MCIFAFAFNVSMFLGSVYYWNQKKIDIHKACTFKTLTYSLTYEIISVGGNAITSNSSYIIGLTFELHFFIAEVLNFALLRYTT